MPKIEQAVGTPKSSKSKKEKTLTPEQREQLIFTKVAEFQILFQERERLNKEYEVEHFNRVSSRFTRGIHEKLQALSQEIIAILPLATYDQFKPGDIFRGTPMAMMDFSYLGNNEWDVQSLKFTETKHGVGEMFTKPQEGELTQLSVANQFAQRSFSGSDYFDGVIIAVPRINIATLDTDRSHEGIKGADGRGLYLNPDALHGVPGVRFFRPNPDLNKK